MRSVRRVPGKPITVKGVLQPSIVILLRRAAVLIKRTQRQHAEVASRGATRASLLGKAERLRCSILLGRSGLAGGGLAALSTLR